ncbi:hypothetical protein Tco_0968518 [Tanacetum coccineum]
MDNPDITMEEYIQLEAEKSQFPAIVYKDASTSEPEVSFEPTVTPRCDKKVDFNFKISFAKSDDEDYTFIYDKTSFSYKLIYVNDVKSDSEDVNDEINISSEGIAIKPSNSVIDANVDAHSYEFDENFEANHDIHHTRYGCNYRSGYPAKVRASEKWKCIKLSSLPVEEKSKKLDTFTKAANLMIWHNYLLEIRDSYGLDMRDKSTPTISFRISRRGWAITDRLRIEHTDAQGQVMFTSRAWRRLFKIRRPLVKELILELFSTYRFADGVLDLDTGISSSGDFITMVPSYTAITEPLRILCHRLVTFTVARRGQAPEKVTTTDLYYLRSMDEGMVNVPYLLAQYLFRHAEGRKQGAKMSGWHFITRLAEHFSVITKESLWGLTVISTWVALRPPMQDVNVRGAHQMDPKDAQGGAAGEKGVQVDLKLVQVAQMPQAAAPAPSTMP